MRIYLDLCCFNRPYDDQGQTRIRLETEAKLVLQQKVRDGQCELVWSAVLDFENSKSPFPEHSKAISAWRGLAAVSVRVSNSVLEHARRLQALGLGVYDALHVACAIQSEADVFVSTDDRLVRRLRTQNDIRAMLPGEALAHLENWYEN
jgi:predicted nucleic acid-binding protein